MTTRGDFSFVKSAWDREMLEDAFQAVTRADAWELLKRPDIPGERGFMFSQNSEIDAISSFLAYQGHSGSSYAMIMRQMEFIAKNGWEIYVVKNSPPRVSACPCRAAKGFTSGWCGVAGGGVPGCDH
jgi:hypothetical protein